MALVAPEFPRLLLREKSHSWNIAGVAATPGVNGNSFAQYVRSDGGGFWLCTMSDVSLSGLGSAVGRDRQKLSTKLWRSIRQIGNGGVNPLVVPRNDALFRPWPQGVAQGAVNLTSHSDGTTFSDGTRYYQPVIDVSCSGGAALRATSMVLALINCGDIVGGESFSIFHANKGWRLYEIATAVPFGDDIHVTISFNPPLRDAIPDATKLEFDRPRCTMRLASPDAMDLSVAPWTFNTASVSFIEYPA